MGLLLRDLYSTTQEGNLVCHAVAQEYRVQFCPGTASNDMAFLEWDCDWVLQGIRPWGLAMFSGEVQETLNRFGNRHTTSIVHEVVGRLWITGWQWAACGNNRRRTRRVQYWNNAWGGFLCNFTFMSSCMVVFGLRLVAHGRPWRSRWHIRRTTYHLFL